MSKSNYFEGMNTMMFGHIQSISSYNYNYYNGIDKDLLLAESDDDNLTDWYLMIGMKFVYIGYSYMSEGNTLHLKS